MNTNIRTIKNIIEDVFQSIGYGVDYRFYEIYQEAIGVNLRIAGIKYERKKVVEINYKGHYVGEFQVDFLVHFAKESIVIHADYFYGQLKNVSYYDDQLKRYMRGLGTKKGVFVLFRKPSPKDAEKPKLIIRELTA